MSRHLSEVSWRFARQGTELDRTAAGSIWSVTIAELLESVDDWLARLADQIVGGAVLRRLVWGEMFVPLVCYTYNARRADWIPPGRGLSATQQGRRECPSISPSTTRSRETR